MPTRRRFIATAASAGIASGARAQIIPRQINLLVPFAPGGGNDIVAREFARRLADVLGATIVVENRAGAGGLVAAKSAATARPDGATLLFVSPSFVTTTAIRKVEPYDVVKDYTPLGMIARGPLLVVASNPSGLRSVGDILERSRAKPGSLVYVSSGVGSILHLATEKFMHRAGITMTHVPYTGSGPALMDLVAGRGDVFLTVAPVVMGQLASGDLRLLAVTSEERSTLFPEAPTLREAGVRDAESQTWWGIAGPPNMAPDLVARFNAAVTEASQAPELRKRLADEGATPVALSSADFGRLIEAEHATWRGLIEAGGLFAG